MQPDKSICKICGKAYANNRHIGYEARKKQPTCGDPECVKQWKRARCNERREAWLASHVRHCPCCGEKLEQRKDEKFCNFQRRVTCGRVGCRNKYATAKRMGTVANLSPSVASIYENEADAIQAKINIDVAKHLHARSGMRFDEGRTLSKAEIAALLKNGGITPIEQINDRIIGAYYVS